MASQAALQRSIYRTLLERYSKSIAEAFLGAIRKARNGVNLTALASSIERGDVATAAEMLRMDDAGLSSMSEAIRSAFIDGGGIPGDSIISRGVFGFNGRHPSAEAWITQNVGTLVHGIKDDTLAMVRMVVLDGVERGISSQKVAREIVGSLDRASGVRRGGLIGLSDKQSVASVRARQQLADLDADYFRRNLRDKRFDGTVRKAIREGKPLTQAQIDKAIRGYNSKQLAYRGRLISQNEAHNALASGQEEGYRQLIDSGQVETVTKRWVYNHGNQKDNREDHVRMAQAPARNFDEPFTMDDGTQMRFAHDPDGGAEQNLHCHCTTQYRAIFGSD